MIVAFKLLSNAPINNLNLNSNVDNVLQPNDDEVKNFNDYQKKLKYRRPTVNEINARRLKIEATAVDFNWVINQSKVYWVSDIFIYNYYLRLYILQPSSREPPSREQSTSKSQELSSMSLIKTDIKDDEFGKDKQGLVFDPYVQKINVKPTKNINTSKKSKKIKRARKLPAFFAPHPDQVKYSGAKAYFYDKPSSRPFNTLEDAPHAVRKYIRGDKRGITLDMENKRIMEKERELRRAEELEKKFKEKDMKRKVGRGKGNGDLGVSRVEKFSKHQTK